MASNPLPQILASKPFQHAKKLVDTSKKLVVITGAGISTDSGIPDYRSPGRPPHKPIQDQDFRRYHPSRQRYWARSLVGFREVLNASPNPGHLALALGEKNGRVNHIITQNVDELHLRAGTTRLSQLHGSIHKVVCLGCKEISSRAELQTRLLKLNPKFAPLVSGNLQKSTNIASVASLLGSTQPAPTNAAEQRASLRPDGDMELEIKKNNKTDNLRPDGDIQLDVDYSQFVVPECLKCGGMLKPNVVFFGDNVSKETTKEVDHVISNADGVMVCGSSLAVWSAFRLVRVFMERAGNERVAIINDGNTRASEMLQSHQLLGNPARCSLVLPLLFDSPP